jgi:hypothetical protein
LNIIQNILRSWHMYNDDINHHLNIGYYTGHPRHNLEK